LAKIKLAKHNKFKYYGLALGSFAVAFILGSILFLPIFDKRTGFQILTGTKDSNLPVLGDDTLKPYIYWTAPKNSIGVDKTTDINVTFYRNWLNTTVAWNLEKSTDNSHWINCTKLLKIKKDWNTINLSEKHTLSWVTDENAYYRLLLKTDDVKSYKDLSADARNAKDKMLLNFSITSTEDYNIYYDWSDYSKSAEFNKTSMTKEVASVGNKQQFNWYVYTNTKLAKDEKFSIDPTFGSTGGTGSTTSIEDIAVAGYYQMGATGGVADSISAFITPSLLYEGHYGKCKLYNSDGSAVTNGVTDATLIVEGVTGFLTFSFSGTKPVLVANAYYYLVVYAESGDGTCTFTYLSTGASTTTSKAGTYPTFPATWTGTSSIDPTSTPRIYCTYTEDATPPAITINFAGNHGDLGGPYWLPPDETTALSGTNLEGYYTNDSYQNENFIYINLTVTDAVAVNSVKLHWYNYSANSWLNTTSFVHGSGNYWALNKTGIPKGKYSFDIWANDTVNNIKLTWWNKTKQGEGYTRRYVNLNNAPVDITYTPLYFYDHYYSSVTDDSKADRLHRDQGTDAGDNDVGFIRTDIPINTLENTYCFSYMGLWFDANVSVQPFTLTNIYYHNWYSVSPGTTQIDYIGWKKTRSYSYLTVTDSYTAVNSDSKSKIYASGAIGGSYSKYYNLTTRLLPVTSATITDNNVYEIEMRMRAASKYPALISNRSFTSFVLFNVPSNATLNASHADTDSDGLSDWTELYKKYTNPFLADTDNDGQTDLLETQKGSDPNNYIDFAIWETINQWNGSIYNQSNWIQIALWNGTIFNTSAYHQMQEWNGSIYNQTIAAWNLIADWNGSIYNQSNFIQIQDWNGTIYNQSNFIQIQDWNGTIFNTSSYYQIQEWNGTIYNQTIKAWNLIADWNGTIYNQSNFIQIQEWNGTIYNQTIEAWNLIADWNGSIYNSSNWNLIQDWNGTIYNQTVVAWNIVANWNGSIYNQSAWHSIADWNGTIYNQTIKAWNLIADWNGSIYNTSIGWTQIQDWNGTIYNQTVVAWNLIADWNGTIYNQSAWYSIADWNGSIYNQTIKAWQLIQEWNGTIYNQTVVAWNIVANWNGTIYNITIGGLNIINEYPSNNSYTSSLQSTIFFTIVNSNGTTNYSIWIGNSPANTTSLLYSQNNVGNGTYSRQYFTATDYYTNYYWRVVAVEGNVSVQKIFNFLTVQSNIGGFSTQSPMIYMVVGLIGLLGLLGIMWRRRRNS